MIQAIPYCPVIIGFLIDKNGKQVFKIAIGDDNQLTCYFDPKEIDVSKFCHVFNSQVVPFSKEHALEIDSIVNL